MDTTTTKENIKTLEARLEDLNAQLKAEHPNHCTKCGGFGGYVTHCGDGWNEPVSEEWDDCKACLGQGVNPLDTTKTISDEDAEAHIEMMMDEEMVFPILSEIHEVELELRYAHEYLSHLEVEEADELTSLY
jgi:hypothetical protein